MKNLASFTQPLIYGLPAWPLAMLGIPLYIYLPTFYYQQGVALALVGNMLLLARVADVFSDPLIGWLRDYLGKQGRYGLMLLGWALLLIGLWQLLLPSQASALHLLIWAMWVYLAWTLIMIPYQALTTEVSDLDEVKTHYTAWREALAIFGVVTVLLLPFSLADPNNYTALFKRLYPILAMSLTLSLFFMLWRLRLLNQPKSLKKLHLNRQAALIIWQDKASRRLLPAYFINSLANAFPATLFVLFVQNYLELTAYTGILLLSFFMAGVLALPFWVILAKKMGKYSAWRGSILLACFSFVWVFTLDTGDLWAFVLISLASGLSLGADVALPSSIQADIAQALSRNKAAISGLLFGVWGMLTKLALALAIGLAFPLLDWLGWDEQTELSNQALVWLYAGIPVLLKLWVLAMLKKAH